MENKIKIFKNLVCIDYEPSLLASDKKHLKTKIMNNFSVTKFLLLTWQRLN